jgi:HlyD family type I secretion membrane fusion protein
MIKKLLNFLPDKSEAIQGELVEEDQGPENRRVETNEKPIVRFGMITLIVGFGGFFLWAGLAPLDEGVPGTGIVSVDTNRKTVQHPKGGVVDAILVREGTRVKVGDVLLRLNDKETRAQLDIVRGQYFVARATEARLLAERDEAPKVIFPDNLVEAGKADSRAEESMRSQSRLFAARRSGLASELGALDEIIAGYNNQIAGLQSVQAGKKTQIELIEKELTSIRGLVEEGFVPRNKLYELERVLADLSGTRGGDLAQIARAQASINETRLRKLQRKDDFRKEVETQISEVQKEVGTRSDQLKALEDEFERTVVKAPADGHVVGMETHTVGGVIKPGDRIMDVVPEGDVLVVEAQLPVNLIDKVRIGQLANMHLQIVLSGGVQPVIEGRVARISADRLTDSRTGAPYYSARIEITPRGEEEIRKHKIHVQPGMQADVVVITGARTVLQYLLRPLVSRISSGMKEL